MWATSPAHTATNRVSGWTWKGLEVTHVVIEPGAGSGEYRLCVDGVDISKAVRADAVRLSWEKARPVIELTLLPDEARIDLPDAVVRIVEALR